MSPPPPRTAAILLEIKPLAIKAKRVIRRFPTAAASQRHLILDLLCQGYPLPFEPRNFRTLMFEVATCAIVAAQSMSPPTTTIDAICRQCFIQRRHQHDNFAATDGDRPPGDWLPYIMKYMGRVDDRPSDDTIRRSNIDAFINTTTLAVAAIEWVELEFPSLKVRKAAA